MATSVGRIKQVYKGTYPNGKIYVGMDLIGNCVYFGSPSPRVKQQINEDLAYCRMDITVRKEVLWESTTATDAEVRTKEIELIVSTGANDPGVGYNLVPKFEP